MADKDQERQPEHLGKFKWNELNQLKPTPTGIRLVNLSEDMWSKSGWTAERTDTKQNRRYNVVFDKEFVLDFFHNKVFVPLGINKNGKFNRELLDEILEQAIAYSLDEEKREAERELMRMCQPYIEEKGLTQEQAVELVKRQQELMESFMKELDGKAK